MTIPLANFQQDGLALDSRSLEGLKTGARAKPGSEEFEQSVAKAAQQFEAIFLHWMVKSMRQASMEGGLFNDQATKTYRAVFDQQLVQDLSQKGMGLAPEIARQLKALSGDMTSSPSTLPNDDR